MFKYKNFIITEVEIMKDSTKVDWNNLTYTIDINYAVSAGLLFAGHEELKFILL